MNPNGTRLHPESTQAGSSMERVSRTGKEDDEASSDSLETQSDDIANDAPVVLPLKED
jgi:hypothetical protein